MDSIKNSPRILQGFFGDSIRDYTGIPQGVYRKIHGDAMGILQGYLKGILYGVCKDSMRNS